VSRFALFALLVDAAAVIGVTWLLANAGRLLGPHPVHAGDAEMPYETGLPPLSPAHERMTVLYHRFAVLFVVFDVDLAFLLPWALVRQPGPREMIAVTVFTSLVLFMLVYFWRKGALECR
jgi:NADH-quinone oxidoreductase subunit A